MEYTMKTKDSKEFIQHYNGPALYGAIWEFQQFLNQQKCKDPYNEEWNKAAQELTECLNDNGIDMEKDYSR